MSKGMPTNDVEFRKNEKEPIVDENAAIITGGAAGKQPQYVDKKKKKRGGFSIFKAALFMLRGPKEKEAKKSLTKQKSTITTKASSNANWKKLVESMRPLHLQETSQSPPPQVELPPPTAAAAIIEETIPTPASPAPSSSGTMSQYSSAMSLRDLVDSDDEKEEDPDEVFDAITGDDMIDVKAEEFIAQFYKQIQLQNTTTPTHHDNDL